MIFRSFYKLYNDKRSSLMVERWILSRGVGSNPAFSFLLFKINLVPLQLSAKRDRWQGRHARMYSRKQYPFRSHDLTKFLHKMKGAGEGGQRTKEKLLSSLINQVVNNRPCRKHLFITQNTKLICYLQWKQPRLSLVAVKVAQR